MFPTNYFLARQILKIVGSQIEIEKIFSLANILTNLRKCHLQLENLEILNFVSKNWPHDAKVGCKSPSDLVEFIEMDEQLEKEL
jgi:hemerythrin-like domain-containing protein